MFFNMSLLKKEKIPHVALLLYWVTLFILTHINVNPEMLRKIQASDKKLHFLVFLVLAFLFFNCFGSAARIDWKRKINWLFSAILIIYAALDEYLQGFVGRNVSFADFIANLAGIIVGLLIISFFAKEICILIILSLSIPVLTTAAQLRFEGALWFARPSLYFLLFGILTFFWIRFLGYAKDAKAKLISMLIKFSALPAGVLVLTVAVSAFFKNSYSVREIVVSCLAVALVVFLYFRKIPPFTCSNQPA